MRARLVRMEPGYRGRQRIVIEIAGDFREQFDQLQGRCWRCRSPARYPGAA